ncbi:SANT/Myb-like DNA-binding domain-containing protein [Streptomyces venezuelae]|uniref:SANT/Myb-like DNA-binding domain-containing protein n=1 Tax=Streptomyces venezuelae TaxID=54571 RepID=UPI003456E284
MAEPEPSAPQFMDLSVPEYAYMFGFLQADGHLAQGPGQKGRLSVEISVRDIEILREFQKLTPYNSTISERTRSTNFAETHTSATWTLCSLEARTRLNELGLPYGRMSQEIAPPSVPLSTRDYLRGIVDGDGSVGYMWQGFPFISLTTASTAISAYLSSYAEAVTQVARAPRRNSRDNVYNITYVTDAAQQLCAYLYYPGCLCLERKRSTAEAISSWRRPVNVKATHRRRWTEQEDRLLLGASSLTHIAAELNRSENACQDRRWKLTHGWAPWPGDATG